MNQRNVSLILGWLLTLNTGLLMWLFTAPVQADFQFNLTLGPQQQTLPDEVYFDVSMTFTGDPGDYLDLFTLSVNNPALPGNFDYTRFSLRNLQNNFQGSGPLSSVGVAVVTLSSPTTLVSNNTLALGQLVLNTSSLPSGTYAVAFNALETDASGTIGGTANEFLQDVGGLVTSNSRSITITTVPEPMAWLGGMSLLGCLVRRRHYHNPTR